jgi:hypothetical protein
LDVKPQKTCGSAGGSAFDLRPGHFQGKKKEGEEEGGGKQKRKETEMFLCPCFAPKAGYDTLLASDNCTAVVDYGVAQEQNVQHRPRQEDAYQAIDGFGDDTKVRI